MIVSALPLILPLSVIFMPVLDLVVTSIRRMSRGKSPFVADRSHFHDRLLVAGHSHPRGRRDPMDVDRHCLRPRRRSPRLRVVERRSRRSHRYGYRRGRHDPRIPQGREHSRGGFRMTYVLALAMVVVIVAAQWFFTSRACARPPTSSDG